MQVVTKRAEEPNREPKDEELYRERLKLTGLADFEVWVKAQTRCGSLFQCESQLRDCGACLAREVERRLTRDGSHTVPRFKVSQVYVDVKEVVPKK